MTTILLKFTTTALMLVLLSACASVVSKSAYPVTITSNPQHINVRITDRAVTIIYEGLTPLTLPLKAGGGYFKPALYHITLSRNGYAPQTFIIKATIDGWYFGNLAIGGILGFLVVDPLTGAMWKLPSQYYSLSLAPDDEASVKSLKIMQLKEVPDSLHHKLVPLHEGSNN